MNKVLGLVGAGKGPQVNIAEVNRPVLRIKGLTEGHAVEAIVDEQEFLLTHNGDHPVGTEQASWAQFECVGNSSPNVICLVVSGALSTS